MNADTRTAVCAVALDDASIRAIADGVADALRVAPEIVAPPLMDVSALASYLGVEMGWVYAHAHELGALHLGTGAKPRLRFDLAEVRQRLAARSASESSTHEKSPASSRKRSGRRLSRTGRTPQLLPIRGSARTKSGPEPGHRAHPHRVLDERDAGDGGGTR
jgi:hypothetical protein